MPWPHEQEMRDRWASGETIGSIKRSMSMTDGQFAGRRRRLNLPSRSVGHGIMLKQNHPAIAAGRTLFPGTVRGPGSTDILKPGEYSRKIGGVVEKGRWKGFPIYCLTLEERATCPRSCKQWLSCYGNNMHQARRIVHGDAMLLKLEGELRYLSAKHEAGFVVRLHVLGDFYSTEYVRWWGKMLFRHQNLNIWGYTARLPSEPIGRAISRIQYQHGWERFSMRRSGGKGEQPHTLVIEHDAPVPAGAIVCPVETGQARSCGTCGLCWNSQKPIAFLRH